MNTPIIANTFSFMEEPQFGLRSAVFYSDANVCHVGCKFCKYRDGKKHKLLIPDDFVKEVMRYEVMGAEMLSFRGGELTNYVSDIQSLMELLITELPIRIHTNGLRTMSIKRLIPSVDGFCVDIKLPLKDSYSQEERERYQSLVAIAKCSYSYRDSMRESLHLVDGLQFTYYTCTTFKWLSEKEQQEIRDSVKGLKSPFIL